MPLAQTNRLGDLDIEQLPAQYKTEGDDWSAVFNPKESRVLDIELIHDLPHQSPVYCVRLSLDGCYVATGCHRSAQIFHVETGNSVALLEDDSNYFMRSLCFSPNGQYLATGAQDGVISVWDIALRTIKHRFVGHTAFVSGLDFASNGRIFASGSYDCSVSLWDIESNSQVTSFSIEDGVKAVAISPDSRYVAAGSFNASLHVWDIETGVRILHLEGHTGSIESIAFVPLGDRLISGSSDETIKMWELNTPTRFVPGKVPSGECVRTYEGHKYGVTGVAFTQHGDWLLAGSADGGVQFWDPHTGVAQLLLKGHKRPGPTLAIIHSS